MKLKEQWSVVSKRRWEDKATEDRLAVKMALSGKRLSDCTVALVDTILSESCRLKRGPDPMTPEKKRHIAKLEAAEATARMLAARLEQLGM